MYQVNSDKLSQFENQIDNPNRKVSYKFTLKGAVLETNQIMDNPTITYDCGLEQYSVGCAIIGQLSMSVKSDVKILPKDEITIQVGLETVNANNVTEVIYVPVGKFYVDTLETKGISTTIKAYDGMYKLNKGYFPSAKHTTTQAIVNDIASANGYKVKGVSSVSINNEQLEGKTCLEMLTLVASATGSHVRISRDGSTIEFVTPSNGGLVFTEGDYTTPTVDDATSYNITKLRVNYSDKVTDDEGTVTDEGYYEVGEGTDAQTLVISNPLLKGKQSQAQAILTKIKALNGYKRFDVKIPLGDFRLEPMDIVSYFKGDKMFIVPILYMKMTLSYGGVSIETQSPTIAETKSETEFNFKGTLSQKVENIYSDIIQVKQLTASKVSTDELEATVAKIEQLYVTKVDADEIYANKAEIGDLVAGSIVVEDLKSQVAQVEDLLATKANITDLNATNATINNLETDVAEIDKALINKANITDLNATNATISNLKSDVATINNAVINKAEIKDLEALSATINSLKANVAEIDNLISDSIISEIIQSGSVSSDLLNIKNGFIKDAMIDSVTASKINSGVINTNNVTIQSSNGNMKLQGNLLQFKDKNGKVRIQIGQDTSGNYTFTLYDSTGTGVLINEKGIQSSNAIKDGLIVDSKVASNANISGSKLNINSVYDEMNKDGSKTLKASKVLLDEQNQTLDVSFKEMTTKQDELEDTMSTTITDLSVEKGKISQLIQDTTITTSSGTTKLKDAYSKLEQNVNGISATVGKVESTVNTHTGEINNVKSNVATISADLDKIELGISSVEQKVNGIQVGGRNYFLNSNFAKTTTSSGTTNKNPNLYPSNWGGYNGGISNPTTNYHAHIDNDTFGYNVIEYNETDGTRHWKGISQGSLQSRIKNVSEFTISMDVYATMSGTKTWGGFHYTKVGGTTQGFHSGSFTISSSSISVGEWTRVSAKVPMNDDIDFSKAISFYIYGYGFSSNAILYIKDVVLTQGNTMSDWTPAPEDVDSNISSAITTSNKYTDSQIKATKDAIELSVSSTYETKTNVSSKISSTLTSAKSYADTKKSEAISTASSDATSKANNALSSAKSYTDTAKNALSTEIGKKANSADVYTKTQTYTKTEVDSAIKLSKEAIELGISEKIEEVTTTVNGKIDAIQIGGTNLIKKKSGYTLGYLSSSTGSVVNGSNASQDFYTNDYTYLEKGKTIIFKSHKKQNVTPTVAGDVYIHIYNTSKTWTKCAYKTTTVNSEAMVSYTATENCYVRFSAKGYNDYNHMAEFSTIPSDWSPAPEDVDTSIQSVSNSLQSFEDTVNGTFKDGIVQQAEAKAIEQNINILNNEKADIDKEYTSIYNNTNLTGTAKTNLNSAYTSYTSAHTSLISTINTAIADGKTTATEKASVNSTFSTYKGVLATYKQRVQEALDNIGTKKVDNIQVGGTNLLDKSDSFNKGGGATGVTSVLNADGILSVTATSGNGNWFTSFAKSYGIVESSMNEGDVFTISFTMKSSDTTKKPTIYIKSGMGYYSMQGDMSSNWSTIYYTGTWKKANNMSVHLGFSGIVGTIDIKNWKIEKGNKPTTWNPSQNDVQASITNAETNAVTTSKSYTDSQIKITKESIQLGITEVVEQVEQVETTINGKIDGLVIGGSNLLSMSDIFNRGASNFIKDSYNVSFTSDSEYEGIGFLNLRDIMELNKQYILQFKVRKTSGTLTNIGGHIDSQFKVNKFTVDGIEKNFISPSGTYVINDSSWHQCFLYVTRTSDNTSNGADSTLANRIIVQPNRGLTTVVGVEIKDIKIELGDKPTSWQPSNTDVSNAINDAISDIQIGGTNLLSKTALETGNISGSNGANITGTFTDFYRTKNFIDIDNSSSYALRVNGGISTDRIEKILAYNSSGTYISTHGINAKQTIFTPPTNCTKIKFVVIIANASVSTIVENFKIKLEKGNKYTDYSQSSADIESSISSSLTASKEYTNSQISATKNEISLNVSNTYETKANVSSQISSTLTSAKSYADTKKSEAITGARQIPDTRNTNENPQWYITNYPKQTITEFKLASVVGLDNVGIYGTVTTVVPWNDASGGYPVQTFRNNSTNATYERRGTSNTAWSAWRQIEDATSSQAKATQAKNDAISSANQTLTTTIANYYTKSQTDSAIKVAKDAIDLSVKNTYETKTEVTNKINAIQVGGTNLLPKTDIDKYGLGNWGNNGSGTRTLEGTYIDGTKTIKIVGSGGMRYNSYIKLKRNTIYTYSMMIKSSGAITMGDTTPLHMWLNTSEATAHLETILSKSDNIPANTWTKIWVTFKTPNVQDTYYMCPLVYGIGSNTVYVCKMMIEEGNKASSWSPCPSDVSNDIAQAKNDAITSANNTLNTTIANYYTKTQTDSAIKLAKDSVTTQVGKVEEIASSSLQGKMLYTDPTFTSGVNDMKVYNNSGNGTVTVTRIAKSSDCPTTSGYMTQIKTTGTASPSHGGFYFGTQTRNNAIFVTKIIAKIPTNYTLNFATNGIGTGGSHKWLTDNKGTGNWKEYIYKVTCGNGGTLSSTNFFYVSGGSVATTSAPVTWYVAMATTFDITATDNIEKRMSTAEQKITSDAIVSTVTSSKTYTDAMTGKVDKTSIISSINQTAESIKISASKIQLTGSVVIGAINGSTTNTTYISGNKIRAGSIASTDNSLLFDLNNAYIRVNDPNGNKVGQTVRNTVSGSGVYGMSTGAEYNSYVGLGVKTSSTASTYSLYLTCLGQDGVISGLKKGVNFGGESHFWFTANFQSTAIFNYTTTFKSSLNYSSASGSYLYATKAYVDEIRTRTSPNNSATDIKVYDNIHMNTWSIKMPTIDWNEFTRSSGDYAKFTKFSSASESHLRLVLADDTSTYFSIISSHYQNGLQAIARFKYATGTTGGNANSVRFLMYGCMNLNNWGIINAGSIYGSSIKSLSLDVESDKITVQSSSPVVLNTGDEFVGIDVPTKTQYLTASTSHTINHHGVVTVDDKADYVELPSDFIMCENIHVVATPNKLCRYAITSVDEYGFVIECDEEDVTFSYTVVADKIDVMSLTERKTNITPIECIEEEGQETPVQYEANEEPKKDELVKHEEVLVEVE